ncbi:MAG: amidohydrolase family protein [Gemmatimonadota bacterium]
MASRRASALSILISLVLAGSASAQSLAITGATIIDGTGKAPVSDGVVLITDGRIAAVGRSGDVSIPSGAKRLDARGKYVIPGLMDANIHLMINIDLETLIRYEDRFSEIALEAAQIALKTGQTTVFDTWGPRAALVKARDMINAGQAPGSRIYLAGNIIGFDGPVSADFFADVAPHVSKAFAKRINETWEQGTGRKLLWMTPDEVRAAIREYAHKEVDFLKYGASGHKDMNFVTFSPRAQKAIVEEGHRAGLVVQAHTTSVESMDLAIEAGLDIVTHGDISGPTRPIPEETIRKLVDRGIAVSTLAVTQRYLDAQEKHAPDAVLNPYLKVAKTNERNMIKAGVRMLVSTDGGIENPVLIAESKTAAADTVDSRVKLGEGHFNAMVALEEQGMDRMEILKSATSNIAKAYKVDAKLGTLEAGKIADLVILDADPLASARNYRRINTVIKDGKVVDLAALPVAPIISSMKVLPAPARP